MKPSFFYFFLIFGCLIGCKKYLDVKPDKQLVLPSSIINAQAMLDNENTMNLNNPGTGEACADNYYLTDDAWAALSSVAQRNMYIWGDDITLSEFPNHWSRLYDIVTIANVALESISQITPASSEKEAWNNVKGSALLYRAKSFLTVAGLWAKSYDKNTADKDLGIPLRLTSDYTAPTTRSSVQETYDQIIKDLKDAIPLLPEHPLHVMRPSRGAAFGLLARTYLMMDMYDSAKVYVDKCLAISNSLLDFNTLNKNASFPITQFNTEVIMHSIIPTPSILSSSKARIDSTLYHSYDENDLRKVIFFKNNNNGSYAFKGSYSHSSSLFNGIAIDEMYLVKAECLARTGNVSDAMDELNKLLVNRWVTGTFIPLVAVDMESALSLILTERRKELIFRDLRWADLKRLNKTTPFQTVIRRELNGKNYQLNPGDNKYALPIPLTVINISGIQQNPK